MIRVITISREYGAGGGTLARMLAERLGWRLVDASLIQQIAKIAKVDASLAEQYDERVDPWFHRLLKALWLGGYEGVATRVDNESFDADAMAALCRRVIGEAAEIGHCVTVGRGAQCILQHRKDALHVSLFAPLSERIERVRQRVPAGTDVAALVAETDRRRADFILRYFGQDWTDRHLYHLMICTSIGLPTVASIILTAAGLSESKSN